MEHLDVIIQFGQDLQHGLRLLRRNPLFTCTAALSLAIGIGADTAIFTVANAILFRTPTGVTEPERLADIIRSHDDPGLQHPYPNYLDISRRTNTLAGVYAFQLVAEQVTLGVAGSAERVSAKGVTVNYFDVLGVRPAAGRLFQPTDSDSPGASPIAILSFGLWNRRFNRDPSVVGQTVQLDHRPFTIVGVAPEGFQGTNLLGANVWIPVGMSNLAAVLSRRDLRSVAIGGRLKPGMSAAQASAELELIGQGLAREYPNENRRKGLSLALSSSIPGNLFGRVAGFFTLLMAIVSVILVIACTNVAGVLLARATARQREIAVRRALGAGRGRLARQLLTETLLLYIVGGVAGLLLASSLVSLLISLLPAMPAPIDVSLGFDARVIGFAAVLTCGAALLAGLAPALQASKADVVSSLKGDAEGKAGRLRLRGAFVVAQVAFSALLVIVAGLFTRGIERAGSIDMGFDPKDVEIASLDFSQGGYTEAVGLSLAREVADRIRALPEVQNVTIAAFLPMTGSMRFPGLTVPGMSAPDAEITSSVIGTAVEPGYFAAMRIPLIAGRDFSTADRSGAHPVVIVGQAAARQFWPGEDPVGKQLLLGTSSGTTGVRRTMSVIGVARDVKYLALTDTVQHPFLYLPLGQQYSPRMTIVARTSHGRHITADIRTVIAKLNPNAPISSPQTLSEVTDLGLVPQRVTASLSAALGFVGLLLTSIGIYGVTAYAVSRRTREIGIRMALGARRQSIVRMVLLQGMSLVGIGIAIGLTLGAGAGRLLNTFLFGLPALDPVTFGGTTMLLVVIGLAACYVPTRRATQVDPMAALRFE